MKEKIAPYLILGVSSVLAVVLLGVVHLAIANYQQVIAARGEKENLERQVRVLRKHQQDRARYDEIMAEFQQFIGQAREYGVTSEHWATYDVTLRESMSFEEAARILMQTAKTDSYYFKPQTMSLRRGAPQKGSGGPATGADLSFALQGVFYVRQK